MWSADNSILLILFLVITISTLCIVTIKPTSAEISKPSVPEFSAKVIDYSNAKAIELTIKKQSFETYTDNGQTISLYYNVHFKLHGSDSWTAMYYCGDVFPTHSGSDITLVYPLQLTSDDNSNYYLLKEIAGQYYLLSTIPFNGQIDLRVQAMEGILTSSSFTGQTSSWTNTQTLTIPEPSTSPSPTVPELPWFVIIPLFTILLAAAVGMRIRRSAALRAPH